VTTYEWEVKVDGKVVAKGVKEDPFNAIRDLCKHFHEFNYGGTTKATVKVKQ